MTAWENRLLFVCLFKLWWVLHHTGPLILLRQTRAAFCLSTWLHLIKDYGQGDKVAQQAELKLVTHQQTHRWRHLCAHSHIRTYTLRHTHTLACYCQQDGSHSSPQLLGQASTCISRKQSEGVDVWEGELWRWVWNGWAVGWWMLQTLDDDSNQSHPEAAVNRIKCPTARSSQ